MHTQPQPQTQTHASVQRIHAKHHQYTFDHHRHHQPHGGFDGILFSLTTYEQINRAKAAR